METKAHRALYKTEYKTFSTTLLIQRNMSSLSFVQNEVQNILNHMSD